MDEVEKREKMDFSKIASGTKLAAIKLDKNTRYSVTKDSIQKALETNNRTRLIELSQYFYSNSGEYRRLVDYFGNILTNDFLVLPEEDKETLQSEDFQNKFEEILDYVERSNVKETCSEIATTVVRDGAFFGYERDLNGVITTQQLPSRYCRSKFKMLGVYAVEFNFSFFDNYRGQDLIDILKAFPKEFGRMYKKYLKDRQNQTWQFLNPEFARAHMLTDSTPMLSPVFLDLVELEEFKKINKIKSQLDIYKIIVQKIPLDKDGKLTFKLEELEDFHNNLRNMVTNSAVDVATTVCDVESIDLQDKNQSLKDDIAQATNIIYSTAGTPMTLFNSGSGTGSIGLKESIKVDENIMFSLLKQYERWYKNKLSTLSDYTFKILFPPITHFNKQEMVDMYKENATQGFPTKLLAMTALGVNQTDFNSLLDYENEVLKLHERMIPTESSYNSSDEGGRPESEDPLSEEGEETRDKRKNDDRAEE